MRHLSDIDKLELHLSALSCMAEDHGVSSMASLKKRAIMNLPTQQNADRIILVVDWQCSLRYCTKDLLCTVAIWVFCNVT